MPIKAVSNGKTFTFADGTSQEDAASAIDDYFTKNPVQAAPLAAVTEQKLEEPSYLSRVGQNLKSEAKGLGAGVVGVVGLPMDTALNIADLAKAGYGYTQSKITGKAPADWTQPFDRSKIPLTSESLTPEALKRTEEDNPYLYAGGAGVSGALLARKLPGVNLSLGKAALYGQAGGMGSQGGRDIGQDIGGDIGGNIGSVVGGVVVPVGMAGMEALSSKIPTKHSVADPRIANIKAGKTTSDLADIQQKVEIKNINGQKIPTLTSEIVKDPQAVEAIKQGWSKPAIAAFKGADEHNANKLLEMVNVSEKGKNDLIYGNENRPADIAGQGIADTIKHLKSVNSKAGSEIDSVAESLKGKKVDISAPVNNFTQQLETKLGVKLDDNMQPIFKGSALEGDSPDIRSTQGAIKTLVNRMMIDKNPDAHDAHLLKGFIDENVTHGSSIGGLKGKTDSIVKGLRAGIDKTLDDNFDEYNKVNTTFSETKKALDGIQDAAGKKVDLLGENADKALGRTAGRLLSKAQSREQLASALKNLRETSVKYGGEAKDDLIAQLTMADQLDSMFGPADKSGLASAVSKGTKEANAIKAVGDVGNITVLGALAKGGQMAANKWRNVNQEQAYKSIRDVLKKQTTEGKK